MAVATGRDRSQPGCWSNKGPRHARLPRALRALAHEAVVTVDEPRPLAELGAVAARSEPSRSRRPCHPRAISSGHQRYVAVSHGHSDRAGTMGIGL
jgi:hypothetical protein